MLGKNKSENKKVGSLGEEMAVKYLEQNKYIILERNFNCYFGEIDIIAKYKNEYIFIEVKTRRNRKCGTPIDSINYYKKNHIYKSAEYYLYLHGWLNKCVRFDVIEVYINNGKAFIHHVENVMW